MFCTCHVHRWLQEHRLFCLAYSFELALKPDDPLPWSSACSFLMGLVISFLYRTLRCFLIQEILIVADRDFSVHMLCIGPHKYLSSWIYDLGVSVVFVGSTVCCRWAWDKISSFIIQLKIAEDTRQIISCGGYFKGENDTNTERENKVR